MRRNTPPLVEFEHPLVIDVLQVHSERPRLIDVPIYFKGQLIESSPKIVAGGTALGREGQSGEVANLVTWLASDDASYVTGGSFDINGGSYFV